MKLIIAIIDDSDAVKLMDKLVEEEIGATRLSSSGGFLKKGNTSLLIGVEEHKVDLTLSIIRRCCKQRQKMTLAPTSLGDSPMMAPPIEIPVGGAVCFILDSEMKKF